MEFFWFVIIDLLRNFKVVVAEQDVGYAKMRKPRMFVGGQVPRGDACAGIADRWLIAKKYSILKNANNIVCTEPTDQILDFQGVLRTVTL